jgi:hypothetical protein
MAKPGVGQSKAALAARKAANKGVKAGTVRKGAAGKYDRKWNAKTARWEIVGARKSTAAKYVAGVKKAVAGNPARSKPGMTTAQYAAQKTKAADTAKSTAGGGAGGTYTKSYERSPRGQVTIPAFLSTVNQRGREQRRIAKRKAQARIAEAKSK